MMGTYFLQIETVMVYVDSFEHFFGVVENVFVGVGEKYSGTGNITNGQAIK
jgi:hypothetical protein